MFEIDTFGLDGQRVLKTSKAASLGLIAGDLLISIDDVPAGGIQDDLSLTNAGYNISVRFHGQCPMHRPDWLDPVLFLWCHRIVRVDSPG
jgi:hypothetical protein